MITNPDIEQYCKSQTQPESPVLQELREYTKAHVSGAQMLSDVLVGRLLQFFILQMQPKLTLDLGTFTGYSALSVAEVLPENGRVITCDKSKTHLEIAQSFFAKSPAGGKIQIFEGEVAACIASLNTTESDLLDFVFIDADKIRLLEYVDLLYPLLNQGGMIVIDNVLWSAEVLNPEEKRAKAIDTLNRSLAKDHRFMNVLLPIRDGLHIMYKL